MEELEKFEMERACKEDVAVVEVALNVEAPTNPPKVALPPTDNSPANVLEAVVLVALNVDAELNPPTTKLLEMSAKPRSVEVAVVEVAVKL